jgi:large subunit ribosomal protein L13
VEPLAMGTYNPNSESIEKHWYLVDAKGKTLGRLATEIARRLRGKHKAIYTPYLDTGDFVVVINAGQIKVTGNKATDKIYYHHTNYPGGLRAISLGKMLETKPSRVLEKAVKGMLPKGPLGRKIFSKLKVYAGAEHPHDAQNPQVLDIKGA